MRVTVTDTYAKFKDVEAEFGNKLAVFYTKNASSEVVGARVFFGAVDLLGVLTIRDVYMIWNPEGTLPSVSTFTTDHSGAVEAYLSDVSY